MKQTWIDPQEGYAVGESGFLIRISNENTGGERHILRDTSARTNESHEDRLYGWCGTYNNVSTHAVGVWRVVREARNGRLLIEELIESDPALAEFLNEFGYPDLIPTVEGAQS